MGGRFSRKKRNTFPTSGPFDDPVNPGMYPGGYGMPPGGYGGPPPYPPGYGPGLGPGYGGFDDYDPYDINGYDPAFGLSESFGSAYGRTMGYYPPNRYSRGMSPWNYGNFYMGNTTIQMIPHMQRKLAKFQMRNGMGLMGGNGFMPMMPCLPACCSWPMAAPMMAVATPLPIACNPLVQSAYPISSMGSVNCMSPSSFMSALSAGPLPYRPPSSLQLPNNIGMIMTVPYGTPNPLLTTPSFGGFLPQYNSSGTMSCCCSLCTPCAAPPTISYYPRPVSVPQPYPVPYPTPVPITNVQQVPIPRPVSVVAPPIVAGCNSSFPIPAGAPLLTSQGAFTQTGLGQSLVMATNHNSTQETLLSDETSDDSKCNTPARKPIDDKRRARAKQIASSLSNLGLNNAVCRNKISSKDRSNIKSTRSFHKYSHDNSDSISILKGKHTSDFDWSTTDTLPLLNKSKFKRCESSKHDSRSNRHKYSFVSDHNCVACQQEYLDKFL